jgi:nucleotide-binding universal stress UspA family protein
MNYQNVLVPIDFSDDSINALNTALAELARPDRQLKLLHVIESSTGDEGPENPVSRGRMQAVSRGDIDTADNQHHSTDLSELRLNQLNALAAPHAGKWKQVDALVQQGQPTECIIHAVAEGAVDLVIMGSHGSGGLGKMLFGSTTYNVARKVRCSVLISKRS